MKLIIAMVQPHKVADVKKALDDAQIHLMTVSNVLGSGRQKGYTESFRGAKYEVNLLKKVRFDIAVNDEYVEPCIAAITKAARPATLGTEKSSWCLSKKPSASGPGKRAKPPSANTSFRFTGTGGGRGPKGP
jgi:nitrogen regulatory protein P-II 2